MLKPIGNHRLSVAIVAVFVATHLLCACGGAGVALARMVDAQIARDITGAPDPHACCHPHRESTPSRHLPACQHCTPSQLSIPDVAKLAPPVMGVAPAFLAAATPRMLPTMHRALEWEHCRESHGPLPLSLTCILRL